MLLLLRLRSVAHGERAARRFVGDICGRSVELGIGAEIVRKLIERIRPGIGCNDDIAVGEEALDETCAHAAGRAGRTPSCTPASESSSPNTSNSILSSATVGAR